MKSYGLLITFKGINLQSKRLVISPDGEFFPYEALKRTANTKAPDYLVNYFAISYAYAARSLLGTETKVHNHHFLVWHRFNLMRHLNCLNYMKAIIP